jgi:hypothetical protein
VTVAIDGTDPGRRGIQYPPHLARGPDPAFLWPTAACLVGALAAASAAWVSAGSVGLLGLGLRHVLAWILLGLTIVLCRPDTCSAARQWARVLLAAAAAIALTASPLMPVNVLACAVVLAILAAGRVGPDRRVLLAAACGCAVFGLYRLAVTSTSWIWLWMDSFGRALGCLASLVIGRDLSLGATFAGVDFLVLTAGVWASCLVLCAVRRRTLAIAGFAAMALAELAWLAVLAQAVKLAQVVDPAVLQKTWSWQGVLAAAVPWNLPVLALPIFLPVVAWMLRWAPHPVHARRPDVPKQAPEAANERRELLGDAGSLAGGRAWSIAPTVGAAVLAAVLPVLTTLSWGLGPLEGRKIVASANVYGNWMRPVHGQYGRLSIGMYGMLSQYIQSLGGQFLVSEHLSEEDLRDASALLIIYPPKPWEDGQLERIFDFVGRGGTLLVFGEHTILEPEAEGGGQRFNDLLEQTHMRIRFDTAEWAVGGWMQSLDVMGHPAFTGIPDDRYGVVIGASVDARWPARPLLVGRWAFQDRGDPGNGLSKLGNQEYDPDEPLGDVILAAEEPYGAGRIIAFGDTSSITNGIMTGAHVFTSRLYSYAANPTAANPQNPLRQVSAALVLAGLVAILILFCRPWPVGLAAAIAAASLAACTWYAGRANEVLPDGRVFGPVNKLAYIDDSHLEAFSGEAIREDLREGGIQGLLLTLMRNGYLPLMLPAFTPERINLAGLVISIAPSKEFTARERQWVREFVEDGGIFILMAGYEEAGPSRKLLADFDFQVDDTLFGTGEVVNEQPRYMRFFKSPYTLATDGQFAFVRFQIAWPLINKGPDEGYRVIAYGRTVKGDLPIIAVRDKGKGKFVAIGDTFFAMNRNLERMDGQPIESMRENAEFWRWFLGELTGADPYTPTNKTETEPQPMPIPEPVLPAPPEGEEAAPDTEPGLEQAVPAEEPSSGESEEIVPGMVPSGESEGLAPGIVPPGESDSQVQPNPEGTP